MTLPNTNWDSFWAGLLRLRPDCHPCFRPNTQALLSCGYWGQWQRARALCSMPTSRDGIFDYGVEMRKRTPPKMKVVVDERLTLIKQDTKKGRLRYYPVGKTHDLHSMKVEGAFGD
ncbi:hypothetical protein NC653_006123 [Populus alba x Populus x berolinensis]|uniref:Uncharacterized protein n=1 Tax=Populus alba x Populus x berolinensis TaxID=444605 RepID=A0AAD6RDY1_9ROSI|nr:hypothetical protein NC653_006123 [Populus alba x Populus x berolinensis]